MIKGPDGGLDKLLEQLRLWHGGLRAEPGHFMGWSLGARFYPVLYMLTRMGGSKDLGTGLLLKSNLLGRMSKLEVHHIFPKAQLYKRKHKRPEVNALANFCFLTKDTNLNISDRLPEEYFPKVEAAHPGALASQWIPNDSQLWRIENFRDFLEVRKQLLAAELNRQMEELLHGENRWFESSAPILSADTHISGGITSQEEEQDISNLNDWMSGQGLALGVVGFDHSDPVSGEQKAVFDLAWPNGIQEELSQPVAVLLNEDTKTISLASEAGFRCFTNIAGFKRYVSMEVLVNPT
jgi:hypothetical protein